MFNLGAPEIIVILIVALLVFGPKKLPEIGKSLGKGIREFRKATRELTSTLESDLDDEPEPVKEDTRNAADSDRAI